MELYYAMGKVCVIGLCIMYGMCNRLECLCNGNYVNVMFCWCYDCMLYGSCCLYVFLFLLNRMRKMLK